MGGGRCVCQCEECAATDRGSIPDGDRPGIQDSASCCCIRRRPKCCLKSFEKGLAADLQVVTGGLFGCCSHAPHHHQVCDSQAEVLDWPHHGVTLLPVPAAAPAVPALAAGC